MSLDEAMGADGARQESYRAAARAAVAELDEIEAVALALQARLAKLRTRSRSLTALLDALGEVVPDAATRPAPWAPDLPTDGQLADLSELPRRRRRREPEGAVDPLGDLTVRLGPPPTHGLTQGPTNGPTNGLPQGPTNGPTTGPTTGPDVTPEDVLRTGLADGRHAGPVPDVFAPLPADVEAWG